MSKTRSNLGSEGKCRDCSNVSKTIEKQGIKGSLEYCVKGPIKVSSPMSKTRSKQYIEGKWGDCSNVIKKIEKQDTERTLGHGANGKMTIGKSSLKKGMTTYAQKWKRSETYKRKSAGGLQEKKKNRYYGTTQPQREYWSGLNPPILSTNNKVTGATIHMLRKENRKRRHTCQEQQGQQTYWSTNEGKFKLPAELPPPGKDRNNMCPSGLSVHHPAHEILKRYETEG